MTPIPKAKTDNDIAKYTSIMQRILDGEDINVISDELQLFKDGHDTLDDNVLRLTDESAIDKMHFFDEHHEQLIRRIATLGGLPFSTTAKTSQNLIDELHDMDALSTFIIKDRAACRKDGFERAAAFMAKQGEAFDFEYDLNDILKKQLEKPVLENTMQHAEVDRVQSEVDNLTAEAEKFEAEAQESEAAADAAENTDESEVENNDQTENSAAE